MTNLSKDLIFITAKSEVKYDVSSNLIRLYMNRCIIDEDGQFEVQIFEKRLKPYEHQWPRSDGSRTEYSRSDRFIKSSPNFEKNITVLEDLREILQAKILDSLNMACKILGKSFQMKNHETHLIIGLSIPQKCANFPTDESDNFRSIVNTLTQDTIECTLKSFLAQKKIVFNQLSSFTVLSDWRNRIINGQEWSKIHRAKKTDANQNAETFYHDVDDFSKDLLRMQFKKLVNLTIIAAIREFQRFKMLLETPNDIDYENFANQDKTKHLGPISDFETYYVEHLGSRFTYYSE